MPIFRSHDDTEIFYKDWGSGRPVILIHGWPLTADSWDDQALAIAEAGYRVISYDRRGFGRSSPSWKGYDYDSLSDDLRALIEHTQVQDALLVGFSMGGGEVARYMSRYGGKAVIKAVLVASILPYRLAASATIDHSTAAAAIEAMLQALREDRAHFFSHFFADFFGQHLLSHPISQARFDWVRSMAMQASLPATLACVESFAHTDFRDELAAFKLPTLIIHGSEDRIVPIESSARLAAQGIAHSQLIEYSGAPHGLFATHQARLAQDLLKFFAQ